MIPKDFLRKGAFTLIGLTFCLLASAAAQEPRDTVKKAAGVSVRTNLLWDGAAEPNIGMEFPLGKHFSVGVSAAIKSWPRWLVWDTDQVTDTRHWRNFAVVPEFRFYPQKDYSGFFVGLDGIYTHFNVGKVTFPFHLYPEVESHRLQGDFWGAGLFAGWSWWIARHWRLEAEAGLGIGYAGYGRYGCDHCSALEGNEHKLGLVPKLGLNIGWNSAPHDEGPDCDLPIPLKDVPPLPEGLDKTQDPARWEEAVRLNREAQEWNAMARQHNQAVQDCLDKRKKTNK